MTRIRDFFDFCQKDHVTLFEEVVVIQKEGEAHEEAIATQEKCDFENHQESTNQEECNNNNNNSKKE